MSEVERAKHEEPAVGTRRVLLYTLGFVAFAIVLGGVLAIYYRWTLMGQKLTATLEDFPAPRLQPNPTQDWEAFRRAQALELDSYGWIDRSKNLIHVPIERAKAIVIARSAKGYDPVEGTPPFVNAAGAPIDGSPRASPQPLALPYGDVH